MSASRWVRLSFERIICRTDKALLVEIDDEEYWLPLSQVADSDDYSEGDGPGDISVSEWIAEQKGLE